MSNVQNVEYLSVSQAAVMLGMPEWRVRRIADQLGLVAGRFSGYRLIPASALAKIKKHYDSMPRRGRGEAAPRA
jgi:hypothetical protein